jgi:uncharacterized repeat protein (TIGR03803 family)
MTQFCTWKMAGVVFVLFAATAIAGQAQTFTSLVSFDDTNGAEPFLMSLVQGGDARLYGTTQYGGISKCSYMGCGSVFRVTLSGNLEGFNLCKEDKCHDGSNPIAGLVLGTDMILYGTTSFGGGTGCGGHGCGTIFKLTPGGKRIKLHHFDDSDGYAPYAPLVQGPDGNFYGTTLGGGNECGSGCGTVFRMTPSGAVTTLHSFAGHDGSSPVAALVFASDGSFYGTTSSGGDHDEGTLFKITSEGALVTLHNFCSHSACSDGGAPFAALIQATDGNLYGTTTIGGDGSSGTVFRVTLTGQLTTLHSFEGSDGSNPSGGIIQANDGNFYGTAAGGGGGLCNCGTVFQITPAGSLTTLHTFDGSDGFAPIGGLLQDTNGTFYGTTTQGGNPGCYLNHGCGTVFSLDTGLGPFVRLVQNFGKMGQTGGILGQGFTGTTSVALNGIQASFTVVSDTFINATVPAGATTGYVTVTTPTGTLTSNVPFHVIP